jgi:uncharacterized protein YlxP (DUF503 family)
MVIGILNLELLFPTPNSLKAKRFYLKRIKEKLRTSFNISVSEIDYHDKWQRSLLGISIVGTDKAYLNSVIDKIIDTIEVMQEVELIDHSMELLIAKKI